MNASLQTKAFQPQSVNATLGDLPDFRTTIEVDRPVQELIGYFDAHVESPGVIVTRNSVFVTVLSRDAFYRKLSQAFGREIFLHRPIQTFLDVWPQEALRLPATCTIHEAVEAALNRSGSNAYDPILVESPDGGLGILEMHALLVAQSQVLSLTRLVEEQRAAAVAANNAKSEFLANISHELRTPLHGIASFARFGKDEAHSAEREELLGYFRHVEQCSDTLLKLVNSLLDLSKLEAGKMAYVFQPTTLDELTTAVVDEFNSLCAERSLDIVYAPVGGDTLAWVDSERVKQVLRNLIGNAVKFSPDGKRVVVRLRNVGKSLLWSISDEGPGIPPDECEAVFDKFFQSSKTKTGSGGTGLGLSICREIVVGHEGRIWVENNAAGIGCTFYCELPRRPAKVDELHNLAAEEAALMQDIGLLVE